MSKAKPHSDLPHFVELVPFHATDTPVHYMARDSRTGMLYSRHLYNDKGQLVNRMSRREVKRPLLAAAYQGRTLKSGKVWASKKPVHNNKHATTRPQPAMGKR